MSLEMEGICYVLPVVNTWHKIAEKRHDLSWYPEDGMSLYDRVKYTPYCQSVVTEDPWIISSYGQDDVRIWKNGGWVEPNMQTRGASVNKILSQLLGVKQTIPSSVLDGGTAINKVMEKLEEEYKKTQK